MMLINASLTSTMIILIMLTISQALKKKQKTMSKMPFECGFSTKKNPEIPFSIQFFMVSVMFIIFDIEISMILSMILSMKKFPLKKWIKTCIMFMMMMHMTLMYEMMKSSMKWMK